MSLGQSCPNRWSCQLLTNTVMNHVNVNADLDFFCKGLFRYFPSNVPLPHTKHIANLDLRPVFVFLDVILFGLCANSWFLLSYNALCHS